MRLQLVIPRTAGEALRNLTIGIPLVPMSHWQHDIFAGSIAILAKALSDAGCFDGERILADAEAAVREAELSPGNIASPPE